MERADVPNVLYIQCMQKCIATFLMLCNFKNNTDRSLGGCLYLDLIKNFSLLIKIISECLSSTSFSICSNRSSGASTVADDVADLLAGLLTDLCFVVQSKGWTREL